MEARAHALESDLAALRERTDLSGDDFLPLLTKFDDLVSHSQSVRDMVTKLASFRDSFGKSHAPATAPASRVAPATAPRARRKLSEDAVAAEATLQRSAREGFVASAQQLADRIANDHGKKVVVTCRGHDQVPESVSPAGQGRADPADPQCRRARHRDAGRAPGVRASRAEGHIRINFEMVENGRAFRMTVRGRRSRPDAREAAQDRGDQGNHFAERRGRAVRPGSDDAGVPFRLLDGQGRHA